MGQACRASLQKMWKSHSIPISMKILLMIALVWPVAAYGWKAWHSERMKKHVLTPLRWKGWERFCGFCGQQTTNEWVFTQSWSNEGTVIQCQSKEASILWLHNEERRELPGERDNARNNARCMQVRKTTHGLDGQHQYVDRSAHGRVS